MNIRENYLTIRENMERAAAAAGRSVDSVKLIAVTKFVEEARIAEAIDCGVTSVGEAASAADAASAVSGSGEAAGFCLAQAQSKLKSSSAVRNSARRVMPVCPVRRRGPYRGSIFCTSCRCRRDTGHSDRP